MPGWQDRPYIIAPVEQFREGPGCRDGQFRHPRLEDLWFGCCVDVFLKSLQQKIARMAELVDALVSNTSGRKAVPVRPRLRVL